MHATPLGMIDLTPESLTTSTGRARLSVVLIEPTLALLLDLRYVMLNDSYQFTRVNGTLELSLLSVSEPFTLAIISDVLGGTGLVDATRLVRKQWPTARILVLGHASIVLEDHLYDDALPHSCGEQDLCNTLTKMSTQQAHRGPFMVTTPASEYESQKRRNALSVENAHGLNFPKRMTQNAD